jgi:hypothetical protein
MLSITNAGFMEKFHADDYSIDPLKCLLVVLIVNPDGCGKGLSGNRRWRSPC